ncbi:MAG: hypothetical protein RIA69_04280, partial [Cyclobacteriaceae bacterium]
DFGKVITTYKDGRKNETEEMDLAELIDVKGWRAQGNKFVHQSVVRIEKMEEPPKEKEESKAESLDLDNLKKTIKSEVENEENQLGLFGGNTED